MTWTSAPNRPYLASCVVEKTIPVSDLAALSAESGRANAAEFDGKPAGTVLLSMVAVHHLNNGLCVAAVRLEQFAEPRTPTDDLTATRAFVGA